MKRLSLIAVLALAVGCAHQPVEVAKTETVSLADSITVIRDVVRSELLASAYRSRDILSLSLKLNGAPTYLGVIDYTGTSTTNHQASTPFNNTGDALCGKTLLLQASTAMHFRPVTTNTGTVTTANGVKLGVDERAIVTMMPSDTGTTECWIAAIRSSASGNLSVWELR